VTKEHYNQGLALFDFDGTITTRDTMIDLMLYNVGFIRFSLTMLSLLPHLLLMKIGLVSIQRAKELMLRRFWGGMHVSEFKAICNRYCEERLPSIIHRDAWNKIKWHLQLGHYVVIVSASAENWVLPWAQANGLQVIATQLEVVKDTLTGNLASPNCNGPEKVARIRQSLDVENFKPVYAYGNSKGDTQMLQMADFCFYRKFD
jgi:phosphatidylglycerophosphatase C